MLSVRVLARILFVFPVIVWGCSPANVRMSMNQRVDLPDFSRPSGPSVRHGSLHRPGTTRPTLAQEEAACLTSGIVRPGPHLRAGPPLTGRFRGCGTRRSFIMSATSDGQIRFQPAATLRCTMVPEVTRWLRQTVQPAARRYLGSEVTTLSIAASFGCRTRNSRPGAKLSEHGRANALDVRAFQLADGRRVTVKEGWRSWGEDRRFLRAVHRGACRRFTTVLGPDADRHHHDHMHMDLARHGLSGTFTLCK